MGSSLIAVTDFGITTAASYDLSASLTGGSSQIFADIVTIVGGYAVSGNWNHCRAIELAQGARTAMYTDWIKLTEDVSRSLRELRGGSPDVMKGFSAIAQAALSAKALDSKTKELVALAISVAIRCDDCIAFHTKAAVDRGATRDEVLETLGMAIYMGAGPSVMYACHAVEAYAQFAPKA